MMLAGKNGPKVETKLHATMCNHVQPPSKYL